MTIVERIETFLGAATFGVVGASVKPYKYGNKVLRCYQQNHRHVVPVNPVEREIEGLACVASVADLPEGVASISIITPPQVTEKVVEQAIARGVRNIWMQPGAESAKAVAACEQAGVNVIADGSCVLVVLGYREH
jgi:predicted CoA-binding protein